MSARAHLIHGIHTQGAGSIGSLAPYLAAEGLESVEPDYGWIAGLESKLVNPIIVGCLLPYIGSGQVLIGHSNGCAVAYELLQRGAPAVGAVFINGALQREIFRPALVKAIDCYWNAGDSVTQVAELGEEIGILDHDWGEMGHAGPITSDGAIGSFDCGNTAGMPKVRGHSDFFTPANLTAWGPFLAKRVRAWLI